MRVILIAAIGAFASLVGPAFAQQDAQAPMPAASTQGQLDNATDDDQSTAPDAFPDSTKIPEPSESGQQIDTAPTDAADGDEPH